MQYVKEVLVRLHLAECFQGLDINTLKGVKEVPRVFEGGSVK